MISLGSVSFLAVTLFYGVRNKPLQQSDTYPCPVAGTVFIPPLYHTRFRRWCVEVHMTVVWTFYIAFKLFKQEISASESTSPSVKTRKGTLLFSLAQMVICHTQIGKLFHLPLVFSYMPAASYKSKFAINMTHSYMSRNAYVVAEYLYRVPPLETLKCTTSFIPTRALNIIFLATVSCKGRRKLKFYGDFKQSTFRYFTLSAYEA